MSRKIKFRVWDKEFSEYIYPNRYGLGDFTIDFEGNLVCLTRPNIILQQFTGLKDKNGKEIYEGDIVESSWPGDWERGVVIYWFGEFRSCYSKYYDKNQHLNSKAVGNMCHQSLTSALTAMPKVEFRVVGNVFENPELLNQITNL